MVMLNGCVNLCAFARYANNQECLVAAASSAKIRQRERTHLVTVLSCYRLFFRLEVEQEAKNYLKTRNELQDTKSLQDPRG